MVLNILKNSRNNENVYADIPLGMHINGNGKFYNRIGIPHNFDLFTKIKLHF